MESKGSKELIINIVSNIQKVILGKEKEIYNIMKGIVAGGHILIEDVPGVGKTTLVKAIAKTLDVSFSRIQFTPDLLPSDITGVSIFNPKLGNFEYIKGPVFTNIVLADEINRTSPKTQSALLEVMEENQISEGNNTYILDKPFIVMATENPVEHEGTFMLPEAQLDRFMIKVSLGYVDKEREEEILMNYRGKDTIAELKAVAGAKEIIELQEECKRIKISKPAAEYIVKITGSSREDKNISLGASTRASIALLSIAQASALINGRSYITPDDIKENAVSVLSHRIKLSAIGRGNGLNNDDAILDILRRIATPRFRNND